jgi:hypothetical protein
MAHAEQDAYNRQRFSPDPVTGPTLPIPDRAVEAAVDVLMKDSGLSQWGPHRATVERRQRLALEAVVQVGELVPKAEVDEIISESCKLGIAGGLMQGERDEALARVGRLEEALRECERIATNVHIGYGHVCTRVASTARQALDPTGETES